VKTMFVVAAILTLLLGVAWTLLPQPMLSSWGVQADEVTVYMARRYGGLFFGYAVIFWLSRASESSAARTAILGGGAVVTSIMAVLSVVGVLTGVVGPAVWSAVVIEMLLAAGFVYFYVTPR
jgi:Na+-driven multidrug efflux pump